MKRAPRSRQRHDLYAKYHDYDSEISDLLGECGFTFEGIFRQHMIYKGRNRDTAWYAIIDRDWPALARAHQAWLDPKNFDASGQQRQSLSALTAG